MQIVTKLRNKPEDIIEFEGKKLLKIRKDEQFK